MDCDAAEVGCAAYGIMVAMDRNGRCCGMQKIQGGSWTNGGGFFSRSDIQHTLNVSTIKRRRIGIDVFTFALCVCSCI